MTIHGSEPLNLREAALAVERPARGRAVVLAVLLALAIVALLVIVISTATAPRGDAGDTVAARTSVGLPPPGAAPDDLVFAPDKLMPVAAEEAAAINAAVPLMAGPNPAAAMFRAALSTSDRERSTDCLTAAIYYEAASEPDAGQRAVAQVVLNRVRHPAYPHTVCGVVFQGSERRTGCQFSFTCDGSLARRPSQSGWERARSVAVAALNGYVYAPVGWATHYHANYVVPYWASSLGKVATVGAHIFYRWTGGWGQPGSFRAAYAGGEQDGAWAAAQQGQTDAPVAADSLAFDPAAAALAPRISLREIDDPSATAATGAAAPVVKPADRWALRADAPPAGSPSGPGANAPADAPDRKPIGESDAP